mgnify:CR=1 FL=1
MFLILLLINIVSDVLGQYSNGLGMPLIKHAVSDTELPNALALNQAANTTVQIVFQMLGASLLVLLVNNYALFGLMNAASFAVGAVILLRNQKVLKRVEQTTHQAQPNPATAANHPTSFFQSAGATLRYIHQQQLLFIVLISGIFINLLGTTCESLLTVSFLQKQALWVGTYGQTVAIISVTGGIAMVVGALWTRDFLEHSRILTLLVLAVVTLVFTGLTVLWGRSFWLIIAAEFASGYLDGKLNPRFSALIMQSIDEDHLAQASGVMNMVTLVAAPIGQALFLGILGVTGVTTTWAVFTAASTVLLIAMIIVSRRKIG